MATEKFVSKETFIFIMQLLKTTLVQQKDGWGLSENNLTDALLQKIIDAGDSTFNGDYNNLTNKPTKLSQFLNDAGFQTLEQVTMLCTTLMANAGHLEREIVDTLPPLESAKSYTIYMLRIPEASGDNKFTEWMVINEEWEKTGSSDVDLSGYWSKEELIPMTNAEVTAIFADVFGV